MARAHLRRAVQTLFLVAFVVLIVSGLNLNAASLPSNLFSRLDPLIGLAAVIASRALVAFWAASLLTVALTIAFGRAWCGWICPLGTVLDLMLFSGRYRERVPGSWRFGKYVTLAVVLNAALFGTLGPMILDPTTILMRPLQEIVRPHVGTDAVGQSIGASLSSQFVPKVALLSLLPLGIVLGLNVVQSRFWCRNICPLGGMLALISRVPGIRRRVSADACTACARCAKTCPTDAVDRERGFESNPSECIVCLTCTDACRKDASKFAFASRRMRGLDFDSSRRETLVTVGATGVGLAVAFLPTTGADDDILRPPSTSEDRLAELCVRCGACYSACPSGSLRPSVSFLSKAGPWTPMLDERPAHCTLDCNRCATACPTDALHTPTEEEAQALGLGAKAYVDRNRCRAWARNHNCMRCLSACPIAGALTGQERPAYLPRSNDRAVDVPVVDEDLCVGCNQCAAACVMRPPAIGTSLPPISSQLDDAPNLPPGGIPGMSNMPPAQ